MLQWWCAWPCGLPILTHCKAPVRVMALQLAGGLCSLVLVCFRIPECSVTLPYTL